MILEAIMAINPDARARVTDDDIDQIKWLSGTTPISKSDILAKEAELKTAFANKKYQRDRAVEYPSIVAQLDDIYHNGIDGWKATIKVTKDKYSKP